MSVRRGACEVWRDADACCQWDAFCGTDSAREARTAAKRNGWSRKAKSDGKFMDLCPECTVRAAKEK